MTKEQQKRLREYILSYIEYEEEQRIYGTLNERLQGAIESYFEHLEK